LLSWNGSVVKNYERKKEAKMATMMKTKKQQRKAGVVRLAPIPRATRERVMRLLQENFAFMDSPTFRRKRVEEELFTEDAERELPLTSWYQPTRDDLADLGSGSPPQLMKAPEERMMFLRFNYCKKRLLALQKQINAEGLTLAKAQEFRDWHRKFEHFREYLVRTNLALVLAMAKRTRLGDVDFAEVVSEGNMALLRAVDKFSIDRGFKFSTYACRAILKAFSRTAMKSSKHRTRFPVEFEPDMEQSDWADRRRDQIEDDCIDELKAIVDRNLADLSSVEQTVIRRRFNWQQNEDSGMTLEEVGKIIGVTKERVRQIQNKALAKIRSVMEDGVLRIHPRSEEESKALAEARLAAGDLAESEEVNPLVVEEPTIAQGSTTI
jgi:RNA polymerase sigma factor (sigma-70 family)